MTEQKLLCIFNYILWNNFSDSPGNVTITPGNDTFYTKRYGKPLHDIICVADCLPECTYWWYREGYPFTKGNSLFARHTYNFKDSYRFRCRASNDIRPQIYTCSRWITVEVKGRIVYSMLQNNTPVYAVYFVVLQ